VDEEELEYHLADVKNQVENLKLLISSVEADLAKKHENKMVAENTEAWLMSLRENLSEVEQDTEEAFKNCRTLVKLLVERITVGRDEAEGRPRVDITYRFGPPEAPLGAESADGIQRLRGVREGTRAGRRSRVAAGSPEGYRVRGHP
jgi:hypothetical protein